MTASHPSLAGKLELARLLNSVSLCDLQVPKEPLLDNDVDRLVRTLLNTHTPVVDGVARLEFEVVEHYDPVSGALIGSFFSDGVSQYETPKVSIILANAPTGGGNLLTCRVFASAVGPHYPGYYHVEGPGVSAIFTASGGVDTFSFVVPAGTAAPVTISIHTDRDRIAAWVFYECAITQV